MKLEFDKLFAKHLEKIGDKTIVAKTETLILEVENAKQLRELKNTKKIKGFNNYYRIRIGDYRVGFELINSSVIRFLIICHRKDVYKKFP